MGSANSGLITNDRSLGSKSPRLLLGKTESRAQWQVVMKQSLNFKGGALPRASVMD